MLISKTFLTYQTQSNTTDPSIISKSWNFLSRYFFLLLFCLYKIFDWKFDTIRQRELNAKHAVTTISHPSVSYFQSQVPPQKIHKNSFTRKDSQEEEGYKEVDHGSRAKGLCGLCGNKWRNPVLLKCSCYVYCKECLERYIQGKGKCPQTNLPVTLGQIVKFFN